jgi:hypothetical protein
MATPGLTAFVPSERRHRRDGASEQITDVAFDSRREEIRLRFDDRVATYRSSGSIGFRWTLDANRISRDELEAAIGCWPGYLDGIEDSFEASLELTLELQSVLSAIGKVGKCKPTDEVCNVPNALKHIPNIRRCDIARGAKGYIYFLLSQGAVVYVGQTQAGWPLRIQRHIDQKAKTFDEVWYLDCPIESLNQAERQFIKKYSPQYNLV